MKHNITIEETNITIELRAYEFPHSIEISTYLDKFTLNQSSHISTLNKSVEWILNYVKLMNHLYMLNEINNT